MAFGDWEQFGTVGVFALGAPSILGTASLRLETSGGTNRGMNVQVTAASGITRGIGYGKIRTLVRHEDGTGDLGDNAGIFCLGQSATNVSTASSCYALLVEPDDTTGSGDIFLTRGNMTGPTILTSFNVGYSSGEVIALELEWNDGTGGDVGGTHLIGRYGSMTDFSDLTVGVEIIDAGASALSLGAGFEGLIMRDDSGASGITTWFFDNTSIFTIS